MILGVARSRSYEPGLNLEGDQEAGAWLFLLPSLELRRVVVIGPVPRGTRVALSALGANVEEVALRSPASALEDRADLVYVAADQAPRLRGDQEALAALVGQIDAGCSVYISAAGRRGRPVLELIRALCISTAVQVREGSFEPTVVTECVEPTAWLIPTVAPPTSRRAIRVLHLVGRRLRRARTPGSATDGLLTVSSIVRAPVEPRAEDGVLIHAGRSTPALLPPYLSSVALRAGHDLEGATWMLAPPRGYRSQKVVFHLPERGEIVKITQDPAFNRSLQAEYDALVALDAWARSHPGVAPRALFSGEHAGLLVVGESRLEGVPFRSSSDGKLTCPKAQATLDTLLELACAESRECPASEAADALAALVEAYARLYGPTSAQVRALERQVDLVAGCGPSFVTAFSHGDPTTHNVIVHPTGGIGLVDWENAEPLGMPLWDLVRFLNAYGSWSAALAGKRWTVSLACASLFEASPLHALLGRSIARYRARSGLPAELVPPLVLTCLVADALRQATRLPPGATSRGAAARLLARLTANGGHPGLQGLGSAASQ
ncbi:hypothetical protein BH20ACT13_BH20ACT13_10660 [soil metagenome]